MIVAYIDEQKDTWGIEPICRVLTAELDVKIAPQTRVGTVIVTL